jgi:Abnormal spindle-like microcephaly-assoc'd, ASPM-SPD-2-Hydin
VAAAGSCAIAVTFTPTKPGTWTASLLIADNSAISPQTVPLQGTGTVAELSATSLNFGTIPTGQTSAPQTVTLTNVGNAGFNIGKIAVSGNEAAVFPETNNCPALLGAGASCTVTVTFVPRIKGVQAATLGFTDNGGASPQTVSLSGSGTSPN